jgi:hypothetical protein
MVKKKWSMPSQKVDVEVTLRRRSERVRLVVSLSG